MKTVVYATFQFEGFHFWKDAPDAVGFLRARHRHMFHVRIERVVGHNNRDVEFIMMKHEAEMAVRVLKEIPDHESWSCERWAAEFLQLMNLSRCEVSEDGENGAVVSL
jgi:hypothetical protein